MGVNENEHVSLVRIPRNWYYVFVWTFPTLIIANVLVELFFGWDWKSLLGGTALERMAVLMTLIVGWFFIVSHIWEGLLVLGYAKLFKDKIRAKEREEVYKKLEQADKEGKTLKEVLESHNTENNDKGNQRSTSKTA